MYAKYINFRLKKPSFRSFEYVAKRGQGDSRLKEEVKGALSKIKTPRRASRWFLSGQIDWGEGNSVCSLSPGGRGLG
jgi:hypothetical protein